ncbi:hypothetical protein DSCA_48860 [Desulfosarcina alkanivorans]|uniref:Type II/III secretion system secretin-like domain-containing protein n=1 Tax=Desulfosarcina alkanivorans TaxID=571177 RepID=A0A5K7YP21_9BACT|nr:hypothetical protein [Desulfosarcina alkanivorans]BBO70956.1 hypothetical protein DSCA_48860 [Desulfosarcina alkanivorans]
MRRWHRFWDQKVPARSQAYPSAKAARIRSTPRLPATDNQAAGITVGKNVPCQTATSTKDNHTCSTLGTGMGRTLKITLRINRDRTIRLHLSFVGIPAGPA